MKNKKKHVKIIKATFIFLLIFSLFTARYWYIRSISTKKIIGYVHTDKKNIYSPISGQIDKIYVKDGQTVKKNDILASYDTETLELKIRVLDEKINFATAQDNLAKVYEFRALEDYLNAKKDAQVKQEEINKFLKNYEEKELLSKIYSARINELVAQKKYLKKVFENKSIYSPFDGEIQSVIIEKGKTISVNDLIFKVSDIQNPMLDVKLRKKEFAKIRNKDKISLEFTDFPKVKFEGKIWSFKEDKNSISLRILVNQIKNENEELLKLLDGMSAELNDK